LRVLLYRRWGEVGLILRRNGRYLCQCQLVHLESHIRIEVGVMIGALMTQIVVIANEAEERMQELTEMTKVKNVECEEDEKEEVAVLIRVVTVTRKKGIGETGRKQSEKIAGAENAVADGGMMVLPEEVVDVSAAVARPPHGLDLVLGPDHGPVLDQGHVRIEEMHLDQDEMIEDVVVAGEEVAVKAEAIVVVVVTREKMHVEVRGDSSNGHRHLVGQIREEMGMSVIVIEMMIVVVVVEEFVEVVVEAVVRVEAEVVVMKGMGVVVGDKSSVD